MPPKHDLSISKYFAYKLAVREQARKLQATLVRNYDSPTDWLTDGGEV